VRNHPPGIKTHNVDLILYPQVVVHEMEQIARHDALREPLPRLRRQACAAVVGGDDPIADIGEGRDDMPELVGRFGEAVDQEDGALY
jgi:hypothetical protein